MTTKLKWTLKVGAKLKAKHLQIFTVIFDILSILDSNNYRILRFFGYIEMIKMFLIMNVFEKYVKNNKSIAWPYQSSFL